jgi:hypothetical protein
MATNKGEEMKTLHLMLAIVAVLAGTAAAQPGGAGKLGVGLMGGSPSGLSAKAWLSSNTALDAGLGWGSWWDQGHLHVHADFLYHFKNLVPDLEFATLPPYVGLGGRLGFFDDIRIGARVPIGITLLFKDYPFDLFLEVVPVVKLVPTIGGDWDSSAGFRYYFS